MARAPRNYYPIKLGLLIAAISLLVLISLTALWLQRNIYDTERFTTITTKVFAEESSRQSIGHLVSSQVLEATPTLKSLLSERLAGHVANLLGTQASTGGRRAAGARITASGDIASSRSGCLTTVGHQVGYRVCPGDDRESKCHYPP